MNKKMRNIILGLVAFSIVSVGVVQSVPNFALKAVDLASYKVEAKQMEVGMPIEIAQGEVLVAESEGKKLFLDTDTLAIRVVDEKAGLEWTSKVETTSNNKEKSIINITYLGKDDKKIEWDAYSNVIEPGQYEIVTIENGVSISMNFQSGTKKVEQLLPMYVEKEYLDTRFTGELEKKAKAGIITDKELATYKNLLKMVFTKDNVKGGYKLKTSNTLPPSGLSQLNKLVEVIGYTENMVRADNETAGIDIELPQTASFKVVLDLTLDQGDLVVNVPTYNCITHNDFYTLQKIEVLPNFGHASSAQVEDGYILVPDGSGALFELNTYNGSYPQYSRPIYNNTYFDQMYTMNTFQENVSMPVFGITYGQGENAISGMMGIVESGEELGSIDVQLGTLDSSTGGSVNNKVYSSVDVSQYSRVKLLGPYNEDSTRYLTMTDEIDMDYTVRYKFFGKGATYYDMAQAYKEHLIEKENLTLDYKNEAKMYLEVLGGVTLPKHFAGIPYDKTVSMTTYNELREILTDLGDMNLVLQYEGAFNNGEKTSLMTKTELVKENGSEKELKALMEDVETKGNELFFGTNLMTIKDTSYPFKPKVHGLYNYDSKPVEIYKYNLIDGKFAPNKYDQKYLLHPKYFPSVVDNFLEGTTDLPNVYINDVPNSFYASYKAGDMLNPIEANKIIEEQLQKLEESKVVAFNNPNQNTLPYCDYAVNISRESSHYGTMYTSIPFRQLVMNGLVEYTTLNANMSKEDLNYYLLQALELGSYPKFTISYENDDIFKDTSYTAYYAVTYSKVAPRIKELYSAYQDAFKEINSTEITNHIMLDEDVFETTYANGVKVITNYGKDAVNEAGYTISPMGFKIIN